MYQPIFSYGTCRKLLGHEEFERSKWEWAWREYEALPLASGKRRRLSSQEVKKRNRHWKVQMHWSGNKDKSWTAYVFLALSHFGQVNRDTESTV